MYFDMKKTIKGSHLVKSKEGSLKNTKNVAEIGSSFLRCALQYQKMFFILRQCVPGEFLRRN